MNPEPATLSGNSTNFIWQESAESEDLVAEGAMFSCPLLGGGQFRSMSCSDQQDPIELIARARDGSNGALGTLLEMYRRYLTLLARIQLGDQLRANVGPSDVVQETFLRAQRGFAEFQGECEAEIMTWLRRILARTLANQLRHYQDTAKRDVNREQNLHDALGHSSEQLGLAVVARELLAQCRGSTSRNGGFSGGRTRAAARTLSRRDRVAKFPRPAVFRSGVSDGPVGRQCHAPLAPGTRRLAATTERIFMKPGELL